MPTSRARTAICSAPLLWPSRPGLPTRIFSGRPSCSASARTRLRTFAVASLAASLTRATTPVGARYSPKTARSASAHSPVVTPACARADRGRHHVGAGRERVAQRAQRGRHVRAAAPRAEGAQALDLLALGGLVDAQDRALAGRREAEGSLSVKALTPTTVISPRLDRAQRAACATRPGAASCRRSRRRRPRRPSRARVLELAAAPRQSSDAVRASITCEPSKRSP